MKLSTPVAGLSQIGPTYQKRLKKLGIKTIGDLLYHFPHRYEDFSDIIPISQVKVNETYCIKGKILTIENTRTWKKRMILTKAIVEDKSGAIKVVWFNQPYLIKVLKKGDNLCLAGKIALGEGGLYLSNPAYEKIRSTKYEVRTKERKNLQTSDFRLQTSQLTHTGRIVPVYPETEGLSSRWLRFILKPLLIEFKKKIEEPLPKKIIRDYKIFPIQKAIWQIHFPDSLVLAKKAKLRFSFEELFFISLFVLRERFKIAREKAISIPINLKLIKDFVKSLPFKLTDAQKKSAWQILRDLEKPKPMNRLLEGDVGSGKTVVAVIAALNVIKTGFQVAFMAPTEILAKQHFREISKLLRKYNLKIGLLTGKENKISSKNKVVKISRKKFLEKLKKGEIDFLIGTHALIQERVGFEKLALVILDEQHRFGVEQRARLCQRQEVRSKKYEETKQSSVLQTSDFRLRLIPHLLSMTATPIPRTLALTIYGDLDLSLIDELPKGRKKIVTKVIAPEKRQTAYGFIGRQIKKGRQVFVICPRIEPDNKGKTKKEVLSWADVKAVKQEYKKLSEVVFPDLKIEMLHGRMKTEKKEKIMKKFKSGKTDILVSTSVIEVGIDIPNATVMMIEGAERFGLAQLHQFRGRVGRSKYQSFCFLFTDSPAKKTQRRLKALITSENGFELAEKDLKIRGPGDFFGQRQWGIPDLAMSALKNIFFVEKTRQAAREVLTEDPELKKYPRLREKVEKFRERIHLE